MRAAWWRGGADAHRRWALAGPLALAAGLRVWMLRTEQLRLDADEVVTAVMAQRIVDGHYYAFYAGQAYMGSAEQYLQAAFFAVFPDTAFVLRLPQVLMAVAACACCYAIALRCKLGRPRALAAAALFAAGPYAAAYWQTKSRGAYGVAVLVALLGLLLAVSTRPDDRHWMLKVAAFGALCGLGLWSNLQVVYVLAPAGWWLLGSLRGWWLFTSGGLLLLGFAVGVAPALWHQYDVGPVFVGADGVTSLSARADYLVAHTLPDAFGLRDDGYPLLPFLPPALGVLAVVGAAGYAVGRRRHGILRVLLRREPREPVDLLLLVVLLLPLFFLGSGSATSATARYVLVGMSVVPVLLAAVPAPRWLPNRSARAVAAAAAVLVFATHTVVGTRREISADDGGHIAAGGQFVDGRVLDDVVEALVADGASAAYADYWLAQPLAWEAQDRLLVEPFTSRRFPHVTLAVQADPSPAIVAGTSEVDGVRERLGALGRSFREREVAGWHLFTRITPAIHLADNGNVLAELDRQIAMLYGS